MNVTVKNTDDTTADISVVASKDELHQAHQRALQRLQPQVAADGFRKGKVPLKIVEKHVDPKAVNSEVLDEAVNTLLIEAIKRKNLRVIDKPAVEITKFVPGQELEFKATVTVLGTIKLADYKKMKKKLAKVEVTDDDIADVIDNLRQRFAEKKEVERAAQNGDELWIDFSGTDVDGKEVAGAKGSDYPLLLGSDTFIKGFEAKLIGAKKGEERKFTLTFPEDYAHQPLANKKVTFTVKIRLVKEVILPKLDDQLAKKIGPFETVDQLRTDIKQQLQQQKLREAQAKLQDEIVEELLAKSSIPAPAPFIEDQLQHILDDFKKNLAYRGVTYGEYLSQANLDEATHTEQEIRPQAARRVQIGILLSEIATSEGIDVDEAEITRHIELAQGQRPPSSPALEAEDAGLRRDVANRLITQKTLDKLVEFVQQ